MTLTKQDIVNDLLSADFQLDGTTDYKRVAQHCREQYCVVLTNKAVWAVINEIKNGVALTNKAVWVMVKNGDLTVLDFD